MAEIKTHLVASDARQISLPWCHVEEFVTPANAGSDDLYLCRATFPPGEAHLFHYHPGREEIIYVLEGQAEQWVGETKRIMRAGEMALIPAGLPHMTFNPGPDTLKFLAILNNQTSHEALGHNGLHHVGFIADNVDEAAAKAEKSGAVYADKAENMAKRFENRGQLKDGEVIEAARTQEQRKYVDPNGIKFDIVNDLHARNSWRLPV